jgi:hypothetical protein
MPFACNIMDAVKKKLPAGEKTLGVLHSLQHALI